MSQATWKYRAGVEEKGPFTAEQLCAWFADGTLPIETTVWCAAVGEWIRADSVAGFRNAAGLSGRPRMGECPETLATNSNPGPSNLFIYIARLAWIAPLFCVMQNILFRHPANSGQAMAILTIDIAALVIGFLCSAITLAAVMHRRYDGSMGGIAARFALNGVFIAVFTVGIKEMWSRSMEIHTETVSLDAVMNSPGWVGASKHPQEIILIASLDDQSAPALKLRNEAGVPCSVVLVNIRDYTGSTPLTIDPASLSLTGTRGQTIHALDPTLVFSAAKLFSDEQLHDFSALPAVPPGCKSFATYAIIPANVNLERIRSATVTIGNTPVSIPGLYASATLKQLYYARAQQELLASSAQ